MAIPLKFTTSLDDSKFMHGISNMQGAVETMGKGLAMGGGALAGLASVTNLAIEAGSAIADASASANTGAEDFQKLAFAFGQSGTKMEQFTIGLQTLTTSIQQAKDGNASTIQSFERLGISIDDLNKGDSKDVLLSIADGMKDSTDKAESMTAALDLLGKGGKKMVAGLQDGRDAIEKLGESARIISERDVATLDAAGDNISRTWQGLKATVAGVVASAIRGPFSGGGGKEELSAINAKLAAEQEAERELANQRQADEDELQAQREKNWKRQLELAKFRYDAEKQAEKDRAALSRANAEYAEMEANSQAQATREIKELTEEMKNAARQSAVDILKGAMGATEAKLNAAQQKQNAAKQAADGALQQGIREGLQTAAERRAEAMAEKRVAREERRLERILANPNAKIGGKTGDAERAKALRDARNNLAVADKEVKLSQKSVDAIAAAIDKLIAKP